MQGIKNLRIRGSTDNDLTVGQVIPPAQIGIDALDPDEPRKPHLSQTQGFNPF